MGKEEFGGVFSVHGTNPQYRWLTDWTMFYLNFINKFVVAYKCISREIKVLR